MSKREVAVVVVDFGSQYTKLIARRIRECGVYSEIQSSTHPTFPHSLKGIILSGSPYSVYDNKAPTLSLDTLPNVPVLGLCYGAQFLVHKFGGCVHSSTTREYGSATLELSTQHKLFQNVSLKTEVWMSHSDTITTLPKHFTPLARTQDTPFAAFSSLDGNYMGLQFHPEVVHSHEGKQIINNFLTYCNCDRDWTPQNFIQNARHVLQSNISADEEVILALSGGVDSSVVASLLHQVVGKRLRCVFVDNGLLRKGEYEEVLATYKKTGLPIEAIREAKTFYKALKDTTDPEEKRKAIGKTFIDVFAKTATRYPKVRYLAQGTIYPDKIESSSQHGPSETIKSHHNVGGLPKHLPFKLIEPLSTLFKDEVRAIGKQLNLPEELLNRHPFPGPGLAIRILGPVSETRIQCLREADSVFINALKEHKLYASIWQAGAILLPVRSVGVMGDKRSYAYVLALRAVVSEDGMTARSAALPHKFLEYVSTKIINLVPEINRVVYDISSKPPATIEWE